MNRLEFNITGLRTPRGFLSGLFPPRGSCKLGNFLGRVTKPHYNTHQKEYQRFRRPKTSLPRRYIPLLTIIALFCLYLAPSYQAADTIDFEDWDLERRSYDGYIDLYITPRETVQFIEYCLVVNYMDENVTMINEGANKTFNQFIISPKSSKFLQLDFNNYNTTFFIKFLVNDSVVFQISKNTEDYKWRTTTTPVIPSAAPTPDPVTTVDPDPVEPETTYNATQVKEQKNIWTKEFILIIVAGAGFTAILGILIGHGVKLKTQFKYPIEFISFGIFLFIVLELIIRPIPIYFEYRIIYFPFIACYILGFAITKLQYQNLKRIDLDKISDDTEEYVYDYKLEKHQQYYYQQTWKSLYLRLIGGIDYASHLNTNYSLHNANWKGSIKGAVGGKENFRFVPVHAQKTSFREMDKVWPFKKVIIEDLNVELVHGESLSSIHFEGRRDAYQYAIADNELTLKAFVYHLVNCGRSAIKKASTMLVRAQLAAPANTIKDTILTDLVEYNDKVKSRFESPYTSEYVDKRTKKEKQIKDAEMLVSDLREKIKQDEIKQKESKEDARK